MKSLILAAVLISTAQAFGADTAENLYCTFTEPFISITFDGTTKNIEKVGPEDWNEKTEKFESKSLGKGKLVRVGDVTDYPSSYSLQNENGDTIVELTLNSAGTDGMSENTYPMSAKYTSVSNLYGGCYTDSAQPWNHYEIENSLGLN